MIHKNKLASVVSKIRSDSLLAEDYIGDVRQRTKKVEPQIESLLPESDRWSRLSSDAEQLRHKNQPHLKPLYGVPVGVKDIIHTSRFKTKANSSLPPKELTGSEATVVHQLKQAGALVFGKTVTTEFAYQEPGPTKNPHDINHTPGGSSSGSAAAVAAGLCPLALGTQTIGSIIRPASFCGVVGFKPSYNRTSTDGVIPLSKSVDHVGFFTQDVLGAKIAASVICEQWKTILQTTDTPTIGIPEGPYLQQADSAGLLRFQDCCDKLANHGYNTKNIKIFDNIDKINKIHKRLIAAEASMTHHEWYQKYSEKYAEQTAELIEEGYTVPSEEIIIGRKSRIHTRNLITNAMDNNGIDLCITPGACGPAPRGIESTGDPIMNLPWTHAGLPTLGIPTYGKKNSLPIGVQCVTRFGTDEQLINWGQEIAKILQK